MWEYSYVEVKDEYYGDIIHFLNAAGFEGWEFTGHTEDTGHSTKYLMKRPVGNR